MLAPALAGSSTHSITWVAGTDSVVSTVDAVDDHMLTTPLKNYQTEHKLRLQFSITGDMDKGQAEIRLPAHIFYNRQGQPIGTYEIPLVLAPATGGIPRSTTAMTRLRTRLSSATIRPSRAAIS